MGERDVWMAIMSGLMIMDIWYEVPIALLSVLPTCLVGVAGVWLWRGYVMCSAIL